MSDDPFMDSVRDRIKNKRKYFKMVKKNGVAPFKNNIFKKPNYRIYLKKFAASKSIGRKSTREELSCKNYEMIRRKRGLTLGRP